VKWSRAQVRWGPRHEEDDRAENRSTEWNGKGEGLRGKKQVCEMETVESLLGVGQRRKNGMGKR